MVGGLKLRRDYKFLFNYINSTDLVGKRTIKDLCLYLILLSINFCVPYSTTLIKLFFNVSMA